MNCKNFKPKNVLFFLMLELKVSLEMLKKQEIVLQKQLEEVDYVQAQMSKDEYDEPCVFCGFY